MCIFVPTILYHILAEFAAFLCIFTSFFTSFLLLFYSFLLFLFSFYSFLFCYFTFVCVHLRLVPQVFASLCFVFGVTLVCERGWGLYRGCAAGTTPGRCRGHPLPRKGAERACTAVFIYNANVGRGVLAAPLCIIHTYNHATTDDRGRSSLHYVLFNLGFYYNIKFIKPIHGGAG